MTLLEKLDSLVESRSLNSKQRSALPDYAFVFPKDRQYPIHDLAHAKDALARASFVGGKTKEKVFKAVHLKYPKLHKEHSALEEFIKSSKKLKTVDASVDESMSNGNYMHHQALALNGDEPSKHRLVAHHNANADFHKDLAEGFEKAGQLALEHHHRNLQDAHENLAEYYAK